MTVSPLDRLPAPYPGELWYSLVARDIRNRGQSQRLFRARQVLGPPSSTTSIAFPNRISRLIQYTNHRTPTDTVAFANAHTMLRYHLAFDHPERLEQALDASHAENLPLREVVSHQRSPFDPERLRFCRTCLDVDTEEVGESYWHVNHQIPFVINCSLHGDRLSDSQVPYAPSAGAFWTAHRSRCLPGRLTQPPLTMSHAMGRAVAKVSLNAATSERGLAAHGALHMTADDLVSLLRSHGFAGPHRTVAASRLDLQMERFAVGTGVRLSDLGGKRWWRATYTAARRRLWPIQHIFMRLFLLEQLWSSPHRNPTNRGWEHRLVGDWA